jgi:uncharacterized protein YukJ
MPINVKGLFETLQYKANNIDSSTSTAEILDILKAIQRTDGNTIVSYDSDGALPDAATTNIKLAYVKNTGIVKFNNGTWDTLTGSLSGTAGGGAAGYSFQGSTSGYTSGGNGGTNVIDKFSFTSDANATDVGDLTGTNRQGHAGTSSTTDGYAAGGWPPYQNIIDKFPFASDANATDVGDVISTYAYSSGTSSETYGYSSGGYSAPGTPATNGTNVIEKYSFSADENATDVGDLTITTKSSSSNGQNSTESGYVAGRQTTSGNQSDVIDKFPFATDANATDVGNLLSASYVSAGQSSETHGYSSGGDFPVTNIIQKFSFAVDANSTDVGDITVARIQSGGQSSTTSGYTSGGRTLPVSDVIDKFPFATDANATDVGNLTVARGLTTGHQV